MAWTTTFTDHAGQDAVRFRRSSTPDSTTRDQPLIFPFQIYSLVPLNDDQRRNLLEFLERDILSETVLPSWDIYSGPAQDVFACVDHQRREIAHRKARSTAQQQADQQSGHSAGKQSDLVPKVAFSAHDRRRYGLVLVIMTASFQTTAAAAAGTRAAECDSSGPRICLVHFDRRFPQQSTTETHLRLEDDAWLAQSVAMAPEDIVVLPEKPEIVATRVQQLGALPATLTALYRNSLCDDGKLDYALGEKEGLPAEDLSTATIKDVRALGDVVARQLPAEDAGQDFSVNAVPGDGTVLASSSLESSATAPPDLSYVVYAPFVPTILADARDEPLGSTDGAQQNLSLLTSVARTFTSALLGHMSPAKTVFLQFHARQPRSGGASSLGSIVAHCRDTQSRIADSIGALVTTTREDGTQQRQRLCPCTNSERRERQPPVERYRTFAVVLDRPDFIEAPGVLFVMADGGKYKPLLDEHGRPFENPVIGPHCDYNEFLVLRSHGMADVARRLAMLAFEDEP